MKCLKAIMKNFKILFRLKTSMLAIILGPLLIIFLIGFAFNSSAGIDLSVGYTAPDNSTLMTDFMTSLHDEGYTTTRYFSKEECTYQLEQGLVHMCLLFPADFKISEGDPKEITFVVDKSRLNIVYQVIDSVSSIISLESDELSKSLTNVLTQTLMDTSTSIDSNLGSLVVVKNKLATASTDAQSISSNLGDMDLDMVDVTTDFSSQLTTLNNFAKSIRDKVDDVNEEIQGNSSYSNSQSIVGGLNDYSVDKYNASLTYLSALETQLNATSSGLDELEEKLSSAKELTQDNQNSIATLRESLSKISSDVDSIKQSMESASYKISNIQITSSDQIVNPVTTKIETISSKGNNLTILFPYALMLIIMFIGMLLSSTLVILEKKSRAAFRVFTTPTREEFYLFSTFLTAFSIVVLQIALILVASKFFFIDLISANLLVNASILAISAALFILIGMVIGYAFNSQQATNMASISVGAILLFISNMILPLENASALVKQIASFNPYVITSETLRRSILFSTPIEQLATPFITLGIYVVGILFLIILFQKVSKNVYFTKRPKTAAKQLGKLSVLEIKGKEVTNEKDFIVAINRLTEVEYEDVIRSKSKELKKFIKKSLKQKKIAKQLTKLTKKELLEEFAKIYEEQYHKLREHQKDLMRKVKK